MTATEEHVWFITGANRGIGFEMTRQLLESTSDTIIAGCRNPTTASSLNDLAAEADARLQVVAIDVTDKESIRRCAEEIAGRVGDKGIDYLVNNAAVNLSQEDTAFSMDIKVMEQDFITNVMGPAYIAQSFIPIIEKSQKKMIINVSSTLGSMGADFGAFHSSYSITKAALNMLTYKEAKEKPNITAICLCPGWLQTDMGGKTATHHVSVGVAGMIKTIASLTPEDSGLFFNFKGERVPW